LRIDIRATRLTIPALRLDAPVEPSRIVPDDSPPPAGCPAPPPGQTTLTVPNQGIATPADSIEGLENKAWIFGHSRWQGAPGLLFGLQDLDVGDEVLVDGVDRRTGQAVTRRRFVVESLYVTDIESGGRLVSAAGPSEIPARPLVILQTSVRESGPNRPWILSRERLDAKARTLVEGDLGDPCKYLLLFVIARAA